MADNNLKINDQPYCNFAFTNLWDLNNIAFFVGDLSFS